MIRNPAKKAKVGWLEHLRGVPQHSDLVSGCYFDLGFLLCAIWFHQMQHTARRQRFSRWKRLFKLCYNKFSLAKKAAGYNREECGHL